jgi:uncharacterized membrane protein YgcG
LGLAGSDVIVDEAHVISASDADSIRSTANSLFVETGFPLVVVTIQSLDAHGGADMQSYAESLFKEWSTDSSKKNRGILLLVSTADRKVWVEPGRLWGNYEDDAIYTIVHETFIPSVREGGYSSATRRTVISLAAMARRDRGADVRFFWAKVALRLVVLGLALSWPIRKFVLARRGGAA